MTDETKQPEPRQQIHEEVCAPNWPCRYTVAGATTEECQRLDELLDAFEEQLTGGTDDYDDHFEVPLGITLPKGADLVIAAMLQATIDTAWKSYTGDREDPEAFWNHLADM